MDELKTFSSEPEIDQGNDDILDNIETYADRRRTVCEVLRELYDLTFGVGDETVRDEMRTRLRTAYEMAKKMDRKLHEYKFNWDVNFWEENRDYAKDLERRTRR